MVREDIIVVKEHVLARTTVINPEDQCVKRLWESSQKLQKTNEFAIFETDGLEIEFI